MIATPTDDGIANINPIDLTRNPAPVEGAAPLQNAADALGGDIAGKEASQPADAVMAADGSLDAYKTSNFGAAYMKAWQEANGADPFQSTAAAKIAQATTATPAAGAPASGNTAPGAAAPATTHDEYMAQWNQMNAGVGGMGGGDGDGDGVGVGGGDGGDGVGSA